jgi:hypothetical protein
MQARELPKLPKIAGIEITCGQVTFIRLCAMGICDCN